MDFKGEFSVRNRVLACLIVNELRPLRSNGFKYADDIFQKYGGNVVSLLLEHGSDPNVREQFEGKTPLHAATDFSSHSTDRYLAIVTMLLAHGADPLRERKQGQDSTGLRGEERTHAHCRSPSASSLAN